MHILEPHARYGVRRINIYVMRVMYFLTATFLAYDAWSYIASFEGMWNPEAAAAWSVWAAFSLLAVVGLFQPLKMLPIVLLELLYKSIWLVIVAYPLWSAGQLSGRAEEMTFSFAFMVIWVIATPWGYVFRTYLRHNKDGPEVATRTAAAGG